VKTVKNPVFAALKGILFKFQEISVVKVRFNTQKLEFSPLLRSKSKN
jgi:hypothetical protein